MGKPKDWKEGGSDRITELMREGLNHYNMDFGSELVPDDENDVRGLEPSDKEKKAIEKQYGLTVGCTLRMNKQDYWYKGVATWGQEEGEKPCLYGYRLLGNGKTAELCSVLNVWSVV